MYPVGYGRFCSETADPRGPNFAEIHARGRRGRLEYDQKDLIPPRGHRHFSAKQKSPPCRSGLIAMEVHYHHGGQGWWAGTMTDVQDTAGTRQTAYGAFFDIRATYDGQMQSPEHRTVCHSGLPELRCVPVCSCSRQHFLQTRVSSGPFWAKNRLQLGKTGRKRRRKGDNGGCCIA